MRSLANLAHSSKRSGLHCFLLMCTLAFATIHGYCSGTEIETIQASFTQAGNTISVTLVVNSFSSPSDMQLLSQAFQTGQDRGLASALFKTKAVGHCSLSGSASYDVSFIQTVRTPTGREITFISTRPQAHVESDPPASSESYDLAIGQFEINDNEPAKSTGYLYPASKLVIDKMGAYHYDLDGSPWWLINVLDSHTIPARTL